MPQPNKITWTPEQDAFLISNYSKMTNRELAKGLKMELTSTRHRLYQLGFKRIELERWTAEQIQFLLDNYQHKGDNEIAALMDSLFPKKKGWTKKHIEKKRMYLNLKRSSEQLIAIKERNRQMGCWSINHWKTGTGNPVGTIVTWYAEERPAQYIKTESGYQRLSHFNWIKANGPIPSGAVIRLKDGDYLNCEPENLECITKAQNQLKNSASLNMCDGWVAHCIACGKPELQKELLKHPHLLDLARTNYQLKRAIKDGSSKQ